MARWYISLEIILRILNIEYFHIRPQYLKFSKNNLAFASTQRRNNALQWFFIRVSMNEVEYLENVNLFVLHTITIDELATVTSPIPRIPSSSPFFVASKEKRRRKMFTWIWGRDMCKRNSPVFMKTETSLILCQAQVGPSSIQDFLLKKRIFYDFP